MKRRNCTWILPVAAAILAGAHAAAAGGGYKLEVGEKPVPDGVAEDTRARLAPASYTLSQDGTVFMDLWFVSEVTVGQKAESNKALLESMGKIELLGVAHIHVKERIDFRDDPIDPMVYVVHLAFQPQDGNHMGTAPTDTFALLVPAELDPKLKDAPDHDTMVELASEHTAVNHPPIFYLRAMAAAEGEFPRIDVDEEEEWTFLTFELPVNAGGEKVSLPLQMVFEGIGDL